MLYRFTSSAAGEIVMLAPHAEEIFAAINLPLPARGAISTEQLSRAITALQAAIEQSKKQAAAAGRTADEDSRTEAPVPFHTRALPFLNMLHKSQAAQAGITWGI